VFLQNEKGSRDLDSCLQCDKKQIICNAMIAKVKKYLRPFEDQCVGFVQIFALEFTKNYSFHKVIYCYVYKKNMYCTTIQPILGENKELALMRTVF